MVQVSFNIPIRFYGGVGITIAPYQGSFAGMDFNG